MTTDEDHTFEDYQEAIQLAGKFLTMIGFTDNEKSAMFSAPENSWEETAEHISAVFSDDIQTRANDTIEIAMGLKAIFENDVDGIKEWLLAPHHLLEGRSAKEVMLMGAEGLHHCKRLVNSVTGFGPSFDGSTYTPPAFLKTLTP